MPDGDLKENTVGAPEGDLAGAGESEAQRRGKERWASMSEADKAAHRKKVSEGVRRAQAKKKARERGEPSADDSPRPKSGRRAAAVDTKAAELAAIREGLTIVLCAPSAVGAIKGDPWLTQHFMERGPILAEAITEEAARNEAFRAYLMRVVGLARGATLVGALAMYVAPALMHMGAMPNFLGVPVVGAPPSGAPPVQPHFVAPERGPATAPSPSPGEVAQENLGFPVDEGFAEELADLQENGGGPMPPLPMEPA